MPRRRAAGGQLMTNNDDFPLLSLSSQLPYTHLTTAMPSGPTMSLSRGLKITYYYDETALS